MCRRGCCLTFCAPTDDRSKTLRLTSLGLKSTLHRRYRHSRPHAHAYRRIRLRQRTSGGDSARARRCVRHRVRSAPERRSCAARPATIRTSPAVIVQVRSVANLIRQDRGHLSPPLTKGVHKGKGGRTRCGTNRGEGKAKAKIGRARLFGR